MFLPRPFARQQKIFYWFYIIIILRLNKVYYCNNYVWYVRCDDKWNIIKLMERWMWIEKLYATVTSILVQKIEWGIKYENGDESNAVYDNAIAYVLFYHVLFLSFFSAPTTYFYYNNTNKFALQRYTCSRIFIIQNKMIIRVFLRIFYYKRSYLIWNAYSNIEYTAHSHTSLFLSSTLVISVARMNNEIYFTLGCTWLQLMRTKCAIHFLYLFFHCVETFSFLFYYFSKCIF